MDNQSNPEVFCFRDRWQVRFVGTPEVPEWVARDVVSVLYPEADERNYNNYLAKVPVKWKGHKQVMTLGGTQSMATLYEPGLYHLINRSDSPVALPFQEWLYEEVIPSIRKTGSYGFKQRTEPAALPPFQERRERLEIIQLGIDVISQLGGIDDRTALAFKDLAKNIVLEEQLQKPALPGDGRFEWPVSDRVSFLGYGTATKRQLQRIGKAAAKLYRARYNADPVKREQFVDGATRRVNCYAEKDLEILDSAINAVMNPLTLLPDNTDDVSSDNEF